MDNIRYFKNKELLCYFNNLTTSIKNNIFFELVKINFFCEYYGKSYYDQQFSVISYFIK